jgi:hypothetical protein
VQCGECGPGALSEYTRPPVLAIPILTAAWVCKLSVGLERLVRVSRPRAVGIHVGTGSRAYGRRAPAFPREFSPMQSQPPAFEALTVKGIRDPTAVE